MFGDLFEEEDFSFLSNSQSANSRKFRSKGSQIPEPRGPTKLSGLRNQGGTCYLNSLLQTLLFTPEFREALFALGPKDLGILEEKDDPEAKVRIIPLQLQRLFAQLLLLDQQAASTSDLTCSFGWDNNEETGQHDVQELNRILFSALESSLEGTSGHNLIQHLYHGTVVNQIKCQECGYVSKRQEDFLDLTVAVKDFCSLEESLYSMYVEEEIFEGDNLYRCGSCNKLVSAAKSAKLGKLPPFLTLSLLRFNFDFTKCERYKETSRYTFPSNLNIRPFCEQNQLDDPECTYELFSVIIHKGGCYGGHYHVYIRDVDELGHWDCRAQEEGSSSVVGDAGDDYESPAVTLASVIAETGVDKLVPVDQLGQKLLDHTGTSWSKMYRKQHGSIRKFLQNHPHIFQLSSDGSLVGLAQSRNDKEEQLSNENTEKPKDLQDGASHWFDFNDSTVQAIREKDIEKQFQGKESAYMLFYRKSQLQRPQEATGNVQFGVPDFLLREMDLENKELQRKRLECDTENNRLELQLHPSSGYQFLNGALHPTVSCNDGILKITVDRRGTIGDLKQTVFELLDKEIEGQVLSIAKSLPAGLHVFQNLEDEEMDLAGAGVKDGVDIFVWDGKQVGGVFVQSGEDCAPILITVLHKTQNKTSENQCVFPSNAQLSDVQEKLTGSNNPEPLLCLPSIDCAGGWRVCSTDDMSKTLKMLGLKDGSSIHLLKSDEESELILATVNDSNTDFIKVQDWYLSNDKKQTVDIPVSPITTISKICSKAVERLQLQVECVGDICLRPLHKNGKLLPPVPENVTVQEAELKAGSVLALCQGKPPKPSELFLYYVSGIDLDGQEQEIVLEETLTVKESLELMLQKAELSAETGWHLRKMDWCYEAGDPLTDEESTLKELKICSGDTFVITEGRLPPKGFLKLPVWLCYSHAQQDPINHVTSHLAALQASTSGDADLKNGDNPDFCFVGNVEISGENSLQDLKMQIMTLPIFEELGILSPEFFRIWTLENKHLGKILRSPNLRISDYSLGNRAVLCVEILQREEFLGMQDMLLRVQLSVPGEIHYFPAVDVAWDISHGCTGHALRQRIANHCSLPIDKVEIAKYLPEKHEWLPISSWTQQVSKKRKKKKPENLHGAPYHLKDGDLIGVKNLLMDNCMDFASENDLMAKERQKQFLNEKLKSPKTEHVQNEKNISKEKSRPRTRKAESALSIRVGVFR
uniref:USP domain-containing protein n=1 Tax=Leptobrachium leishanense TaxID=445787 RepID=A0A8C5Q031_9ANUR